MTNQIGFEFPQPLTEKYRPTRIADFAGLDKPKKIMSKLAANPFPSAWLFTGPSGTGKTTMALALAAEMQAELHHVPSQSCNLETIERIRRTCQYVPMQGCKYHLVLIDEVDRISPAAQIALLSKLDATDFPPNTIFVATSNDISNLEGRLVSRFHVLEFSSYGLSEQVADLLRRVWTSETDSPDMPDFKRLVKNAGNNVRSALMALETELMAC
jgi:replication-associated recombination protein RarA